LQVARCGLVAVQLEELSNVDLESLDCNSPNLEKIANNLQQWKEASNYVLAESF
jgi:hypothetical protein